MQQSDNSLPSENKPIVLPRHAINLALRVLQLLSGVESLTLHVIRIDGAWYLIGPGDKVEKLG